GLRLRGGLTTYDFGNFDRTRTGWTAGGGVEWMFARGWSAFLEGNYMDFGDNSHTVFGAGLGGACGAVGGCIFDTHAKAVTVLVGVNYRFGGGKAPYSVKLVWGHRISLTIGVTSAAGEPRFRAARGTLGGQPQRSRFDCLRRHRSAL